MVSSTMRYAWLIFGFLGLLAGPAWAGESTLEGGAQIWFGTQWGEFRADVGPRWAWSWFSIHPHGALGAAVVPGVDSTLLSLGGYADADITIPLGTKKGLQIGPGGGLGLINGLGDRGVLPQGYLQAAYRWDGNIVGLQALAGPSRDWLGVGGVRRLHFSGVGLRFEYVIQNNL